MTICSSYDPKFHLDKAYHQIPFCRKVVDKSAVKPPFQIWPTLQPCLNPDVLWINM